MQSIRTICCKLDPAAEQDAEIEATLKAFADACNHIAGVARAIHSTNKVAVQKACYADVRTTFGLSANLTVRTIARACAALKVKEKMHSTFSPTSIDYDARIFSFREWDWTFSLTLLNSRQRLSTRLGEFQREALKGQRPTSATLVRRDGGDYYLHVQVSEDAPEPLQARGMLGIDLGIVNIATDSSGETFSGQKVERTRRRRATARKQYQRRGTKSAKRRLRKMAGKQRRFQAAENHRISKQVVAKAKAQGAGIALENLSGIRGRTENTAGKSFRRRLGNWGFYQLKQFVEYKAARAGVPVVLVNPRNTSRTCSVCGHCEKANRKSQAVFLCKHCGFSTNADINAARNISGLGRLVSPPQKSRASAQGQSRLL